MKKCVVCLVSGIYPICKNCIKDPFSIERCRQELATIKDYTSLKKLYNKSIPGIFNKNSKVFWDEKFFKTYQFKSQDGITKDRIKTAVSFIPPNINNVLDVGAGYGFFEEYFYMRSRNNAKIYGFDISRKAVKYLNERFESYFKIGSIYNPPFIKNKFDVIVALEILEHIPPNKIFFVLNNLRKLLIEDGLLIVSVPLNEKLRLKKDNPSGHLREYTKSLVLTELKFAKFKVLKTKEFYAFKNFYSAKKFMQKIIKKKSWEVNDIVIKAKKL